MGLFDMIMIKDNHIKAAGGIKKAVEMVRKKYGSRYIVEVETSSMEEVADALSSGADIIMLDNMEIEMVGRAVELIHKKAKVEISGNVEQERIIGIRHLAVDYISMGALTHSVRAFDFSMTFRK
ncbi:MAG: nicotinate-nucleotide diphosphorylase (carboxylating), partial [Chrysiogenales bacterium]